MFFTVLNQVFYIFCGRPLIVPDLYSCLINFGKNNIILVGNFPLNILLLIDVKCRNLIRITPKNKVAKQDFKNMNSQSIARKNSIRKESFCLSSL